MNGKNCISVVLLSSTLAACGGGGGGSTGTSNSITSAKLSPELAQSYNRNLPDAGGGAAAYVATVGAGGYGIAQLSELNRRNFTSLFVLSVIEGYDIGMAFQRPASESETNTKRMGVNKIEDAVIRAAEQAFTTIYSDYQARPDYQAKPVSITEVCDGGGSLTLTGDLNDSTGIGTLDVNYGNCVSGGLIARGSGTLVVNAKNLTYDKFSDYTFQYNDLSLYGINTNELWLYTGSKRVKKTLVNGITTDFSVQSDLQRFNHDTTVQTYDGTLYEVGRSGEKLSGVLCDNVHGCADVSTRILFAFNWSGGEATMTGVNKSAIRIRLSNRAMFAEVDGEGDGTYGQTIKIYELP